MLEVWAALGRPVCGLNVVSNEPWSTAVHCVALGHEMLTSRLPVVSIVAAPVLPAPSCPVTDWVVGSNVTSRCPASTAVHCCAVGHDTDARTLGTTDCTL